MVRRQVLIFKWNGFLMAYTMVKKGQVFNWAHMLAFNIFQKAKEAPGMKKPSFFILAYIIDAICSVVHFPTFGWN
jgi:hypothetical protein